jgi:hypothetical protein
MSLQDKTASKATAGRNNVHGSNEPPDFSLVLGGPLFQFILVRWYFRLFIWAGFLWQTSRLELNRFPTHPDRASGLGFLGMSSAAFAPLLMAHGPLLVFSPRLMRAKRTGLREYGILASRYVREFDRKWVRGGATADEQLMGSGDIQSLADLGNSFQVIRDIRPFPFGRDAVIRLVVFTLIPVSPLVFTTIPLDELVRKLLGAVF